MRTDSTLLPTCLKELGEASTLLVMDALIRQLGCSTGNFISATIVPAFHDIAALCCMNVLPRLLLLMLVTWRPCVLV
jgi:hypothetical protein